VSGKLYKYIYVPVLKKKIIFLSFTMRLSHVCMSCPSELSVISLTYSVYHAADGMWRTFRPDLL